MLSPSAWRARLPASPARSSALAMLAAAALTLGGCEGSSPGLPAPASSAAPASPAPSSSPSSSPSPWSGPAPAPSPTASAAAGEAAAPQLITKLNIYVACLNNMNPAVRYSRERYLGWADRDKGPSLGAARQGINEISAATTYGYECFKRDGGLAAALQGEPRLAEIDAAGAVYQQALDAVMEVTQKAATYYEQGDYKDDRLAQGKTLHKALLTAFDGLDSASDGLIAALDKLQDELLVKELARLEQTEGKQALWHQQHLMRLAGLTVRQLIAADLVDERTMTPAITAFTTALADLRAWTRANQAVADKNVSWGSFVGYADELAAELKELGRGLRDHHQAPRSGAGSVEQVVASFNRLVEFANRLWD